MIGIVFVAFVTAWIAYGLLAKGDELASDLFEPLERGSVKSGIDAHVLPVDKSGLAQPPEKTLRIFIPGNGTDPRKLGRRPLRPRRERPRRRCAK